MVNIIELYNEILEEFSKYSHAKYWTLIDVDFKIAINNEMTVSYEVFAQFRNSDWEKYTEAVYEESKSFEELKASVIAKIEQIINN